MQHFIQVPRLSHSIALFLSLENEVERLFKLMQIMGEGGGGGVAYKQGCLESSGKKNLQFYLALPAKKYEKKRPNKQG